ncbi:MAG: LruC domain-containing protein [Bacteroidota bacterium]
MKKILIITFLAILSMTGFSQTVTNNFENGNWLYYSNLCWGIGVNNQYERFNTDVIGNGFTGTRVCQTQNLGEKNICSLESPWTNLAAGNIEFDHAVPSKDGSRQLKVYLVKEDGTSAAIWTFPYSNGNSNHASIANNVTGIRKIRWEWTGNNGNSRGQLDNIVIPGVNASDPSNDCKPMAAIIDADGDGVPDAQDEYPADPYRAYNNYYPATGFGTIAFEDNWPAYGDYDLNDLVMGYKFKIVSNAQHNVVEIFNTMLLRANGAGMENGFGYQLPNVTPTSVRSVTGTGDQTGYTIGANGTETGNSKATIILFDKSHRYMNEWNTQLGVAPVPAYQFDVYLEFMKNGVPGPGGAITVTNLNIAQWNPFLVANGQRGREVHLPNYMPTDQADVTLFGTSDDDTRIGHYYKSKTNLPWALDIYGQFDYPAEHMDISLTYLHFGQWVETSGSQYLDWWSNKTSGYRDNTKIY